MNLSVSQEHDDREDIRTVTKFLDEERSIPKKFDRNEKLFIHCLSVFMISFRCFVEVDEKLYQKKLNQFLENMISLCNLPFFDIKRREVLLSESEKCAAKYNYFIELSILKTDGIDSIASRTGESKVSVRVEWIDKNHIYHKSYKLYPFRHTWMPSYDWVTKKLSKLIIKIRGDLIDKNNEFNIYLLIRSSRADKIGSLLSVFPLGIHRFMGITKKILILKFTPTQLTWSGFQKSFTCDKITLLLRLKWKYRKCSLLRPNMNMIQKLFEQFLRYEWRKRSPYQMFSAKCKGGNKQGFCVSETLLTNEIWNQREPFWRKPLESNELAVNSYSFCTCSLWCNINSFYFYNPIAVFLLGQTRRIYDIPYTRIVPYHFTAICKLIEEKNFVCFSLLSSLLQMLYYYLEDFYSQNQEFSNPKCIEIIEEGYFYLRKFLVKPDSFKGSCRRPFDEYEKEFKFFIQAMIWLSLSIKGLDDRKLSKRLRYKFQDVIISWIDTVLDNPSENISSTIVTLEFNKDQDTEEDIIFSYDNVMLNGDYINYSRQTLLENDVKNFEPTFESLWDFDKDISEEEIALYTMGLYKKEKLLPSSNDKINLICSKHLSLLHRLNDFLLNVAPLVPFDFYDKRLYKIEVVMICQLDSEFKTRSNSRDYYITFYEEKSSQLKKAAIKHYTILLYSIAYNIQNFMMERHLFTFYKEFNLQLSINRIKFFSTNDWIENITTSNELKPLFRNINGNKSLFENWFKLYQSYWNLPTKNNLSLDENSIIKNLAYECLSIGFWIKHKKEHEKSLKKHLNKVIKILKNYQKDLKTNIDSYMNANKNKFDNKIEIPIQQLIYCFKAFCFNMLCLSINLIQHFDNLFSDLHKRFGFILLCPLWVELLKFNNTFASTLQTSISLLPGDNDLKDKVKKYAIQTMKNINITMEDIFIKLSRKLIQEIHYLVFMYKNKYKKNVELKKENMSLSIHIVRLMILYGYCSLSRFKSNFNAGHSLLNEKLHELGYLDPFLKDLICKINENKLSFYSSTWLALFEEQVNVFIQKFPKMFELISQWKPNEPRPSQDIK